MDGVSDKQQMLWRKREKEEPECMIMDGASISLINFSIFYSTLLHFLTR